MNEPGERRHDEQLTRFMAALAAQLRTESGASISVRQASPRWVGDGVWVEANIGPFHTKQMLPVIPDGPFDDEQFTFWVCHVANLLLNVWR